MTKLALFTASRSALDIARISAHAIDGALSAPAELWTSIVEGDAVLLGAFQRTCEIDATSRVLLRRASGGPAIALGSGTIHMALALENSATLTACDPPRLVNRYVRPLLRALASLGEKAAYFGRDWVSVHHRPAAWVGFAHDSITKRAVFEAVIGVRARWSVDRNRASFLDKSEITIEEAIGHALDPSVVAEVIAAEYGKSFGGEKGAAPALEAAAFVVGEEPNWSAVRDEAIGIVAAGRDRSQRVCVGGHFLASRDAVSRLNASLATFTAETSIDTIGGAVDSALAAPGVTVHGIKSLISVRDVIAEALRI
ncbi:MAG: hypothetical protein ABI461_05230 [Polyangiaceae bacterium]